MRLDNMICDTHSSIGDVMRAIDKNTKGIAFITDDSERLIGVLTDGDIRRILLSGGGLNDLVSRYINRVYVYGNESDDWATITKKFDGRVTILPIVDDNMRVVDVIEFNSNTKISLAKPQMNGNEYKYLMDAFLSTWISSSGAYITQFEKTFSAFCEKKYGVATSNGTTALHLALVALGIGKGDEVIVPNLTFAATINAVLYTGATPVIVDIDRESWCISPECIKKAITERTKAVIPVHLYGQACDMDSIMNIAKENNLYVIEDCAEAHGATFGGKKVGSFGDISCFSFYGNKVITTGEGGMCITDDSGLEAKMRVLRDHGMSKEHRYYHEVIGFNYRMTNMQGAIGAAQVEHIEDILEWRDNLDSIYREKMEGLNGVVLQRNNLPKRHKINWLFSILVDESERDNLMERLKDNGIDVRAFFIPLSEMDVYKEYANEECPVSCEISKRGINLPTTFEVDGKAIDKIVDVIRGSLG